MITKEELIIIDNTARKIQDEIFDLPNKLGYQCDLIRTLKRMINKIKKEV